MRCEPLGFLAGGGGRCSGGIRAASADAADQAVFLPRASALGAEAASAGASAAGFFATVFCRTPSLEVVLAAAGFVVFFAADFF